MGTSLNLYQIHRNLNKKIGKIDQNNHFLPVFLGMIKLNYEKVSFITFVPNRLIDNCTKNQLFKQKGLA
jgi:hypothetical protein